MLPDKQDSKSHKKNRYHKRNNASDLATSSPRAAARWLKNVCALGVTTVLSAGILVACGQMSSAENNAKNNAKSNAKSNANASSQNSGVKNSRDMLPSDMLGQMQALPQLTKGLGDTGAAVIDPNKPTLIKFWASWCPLCLGTLAET